jgi:hypothetical protein
MTTAGDNGDLDSHRFILLIIYNIKTGLLVFPSGSPLFSPGFLFLAPLSYQSLPPVCLPPKCHFTDGLKLASFGGAQAGRVLETLAEGGLCEGAFGNELSVFPSES